MLRIGDIGNGLSAVLDAIAGGIVRMIERPGDEANAGVRGQNLAGGEIDKVDLGSEDPHRDREQRRNHHAVEHRFDALAVQVTGPDPYSAPRVVAWGKERQSADMVEMRMAVEQVQLGRPTAAHQLVAQQAQPGSAVEDHQVLPAADLHARSVAPVTHGVGPWAGDAAAYAPKPHRVIRMDQGPTPSCRCTISSRFEQKLYSPATFTRRFAKFLRVFL